MMVNQLGTQVPNITPEMVQQYLESPESPLKLNDMIDGNLAKICEESNLTGITLK
jgi:hypothetical protein